MTRTASAAPGHPKPVGSSRRRRRDTRYPRPAIPALALILAIIPLLTHPQEPTYDQVAPIFAARCVLCHNGPAAPRGVRLDSLAAILAGGERGPIAEPSDPEGSELLRRIRGTSLPRMPITGPPFLSEEEADLIARWVAAGLPSGDSAVALGPTVVPPPAEGPPTFAQVAPILATRCAKCHTDNGLSGPPPEGYRLTSHAEVVSATDRLRVVPGRPEASELVRRIRGQALPRMPFDGPPFLSDDEIRLIEDWIAAGARDTQGEPAALPLGARLRLHGTLTGRWRLDDLEVHTDTDIRKGPRNGDYVEVRGRLGPDGSVRAERIRAR